MSGVEDGSFIHFYDALERWSNSQVLKRKSIFSNASVVELLDGHCFIGHPGVSEVTFHSKKGGVHYNTKKLLPSIGNFYNFDTFQALDFNLESESYNSSTP